MEVKRKNLKEDFKLLMSLGESYEGYKFKLVFTAGKYGNVKYVCSYDGEEYKNCVMADDTHVLCLMDNHGLPCGLLSVETTIYIPDAQMPDGYFKKSDKRLFEFPYEGRMYHLEFTNGKSDDLETPEILLDIIGTVIKGDPISFDDLTPEQLEKLQESIVSSMSGVLDSKQDALVSGENIKTINEQSLLGDGNIEIYQPPTSGIPKKDLSADVQGSLSKADTALQKHQSLEGKQDVIVDLPNIRSGAALGNTSVQPADIKDMESRTHAAATYQPKGEYLTHHQDISGKQDIIADLADIRSGASKGATAVQPSDIDNALKQIESAYQPKGEYQPKGDYALAGSSYTKEESDGRFLTEHQDLSGKQDVLKSGVNIKMINGQSLLGNGNIIIEGGGGSGGYEPPVNGIPKSDLAEDVRESLSKADTALQEHQDLSGKQDVIDDLDEIRSGAALGATAIQSHQDISGKQDVISDLATIRSGAELGASAVQPSAISDMETKTDAAAKYQPKGNYLTEHQSLDGLVTEDELQTMQDTVAAAIASFEERLPSTEEE